MKGDRERERGKKGQRRRKREKSGKTPQQLKEDIFAIRGDYLEMRECERKRQ